MSSLTDDFSGLVTANPIASVATAAGVGLAVGGVVGGVVGAVSTKKRKKRRNKAKSVRKKRSRSKRKRYRRTPRTAGKGKDRSTKRIRYTKKGQPYVIMKSGKARFIKKSSAKQSRKRKGGRY